MLPPALTHGWEAGCAAVRSHASSVLSGTPSAALLALQGLTATTSMVTVPTPARCQVSAGHKHPSGLGKLLRLASAALPEAGPAQKRGCRPRRPQQYQREGSRTAGPRLAEVQRGGGLSKLWVIWTWPQRRHWEGGRGRGVLPEPSGHPVRPGHARCHCPPAAGSLSAWTSPDPQADSVWGLGDHAGTRR